MSSQYDSTKLDPYNYGCVYEAHKMYYSKNFEKNNNATEAIQNIYGVTKTDSLVEGNF